jgi:hypothetical protein
VKARGGQLTSPIAPKLNAGHASYSPEKHDENAI